MVKDEELAKKKMQIVNHIKRINSVRASNVLTELGLDRGSYYRGFYSYERTLEAYEQFLKELKEAIKDK